MSEFDTLALKYRPRTYDQIKGNVKTVNELRNRTVKKDFPKVVLFTGMTGSGKTTLELIYAKSIFCNNIQDGNPCNVCKTCQEVDKGINTEYLRHYEGGSFGVDEAQDLKERTNKNILGSSSNKKLFIIDELQSIKSKSAEEKLLKVLEKEDDDCYYILGAMRWDKLGSALKGRSIKYHLSLEPTDIGIFIANICNAEGINVDENMLKILRAIVDASKGSMRDAISYLQRVIYSEIKTEEELLQELNIISNDGLNTIINGILLGKINVLENMISEDILEELKWKLLLVYKNMAGLKLKGWEIEKIKGINTVKNISILQRTISELNELRKYPYIDKALIEYYLTNIILSNQVLNSQDEEPVRRRRSR